MRTVGPSTFAVPNRLFTSVPEEILLGSVVGGHRSVSPDEETESMGVARPEGLVSPGRARYCPRLRTNRRLVLPLSGGGYGGRSGGAVREV
ncbi:hypothetical protein [Streptomyces xinghaiensis]|uniref:hypothetical protein n=1 Tax=Streptomyces xinghaiensis TaxID=1038928 RepID=UPI000A998AB1|nr:hypothetical protein [Streptomyces xinghaiensis]